MSFGMFSSKCLMRRPVRPFISLLTLCLSQLAVCCLAVSSPVQRDWKSHPTCKTTLASPDQVSFDVQNSTLIGQEEKRERLGGASHPAFSLKSSDFVSEYELAVEHYVHSTGISVWSLSTPPLEREMTFIICVRTPVADSYGTPHVLEHAVLQGSTKHPVSSVFSYLRRRSLQTHLNAYTWPDRTCFPVASLNLKDLYNLAGVYMHAVFNPLAVLNPLILAQEGCHLELVPREENPTADCRTTPDACTLRYNGVVFSEMKGVWSNPASAQLRYLLRELLPDNPTYWEFSGGLPTEIPKLTFQHLKQFHETHYVPENAWIIFYGPDDVYRRLQFVDEFFSENGRKAHTMREAAQIGPQVAFKEPKYVEYSFATSSSPLKDLVSIAWVLDPCSTPVSCEEIDAETRVALNVLVHLLMKTRTSPLYRALVDSRLSETVSNANLDFESRHATLSIGLEGVEHRDGAAADIEALVLQTLSSLSESGFPEKDIAAALNSIELRWREFTRSPTLPRGHTLSRIMNNFITYGKDPVSGMRFEDAFRAIRLSLSRKERVFERLIDKYLLKNPHRVTIRMKASTTKALEVEEEERKTLEALRAQMTQEELNDILETQRAVKRAQETPPTVEALKTLPILEKEDIDTVDAEGRVPVLSHKLPTLGLVYIDVGLSLADLSLEDILYLPLLAEMLEEAGTADIPPEELIPLVGRFTGGIKASYGFRPASAVPYTVPDPYSGRGFLFLSGTASNKHSVELWCLLHLLLVETNFDNFRSGEEIVRRLIRQREMRFRSHAFRASRVKALSSFGVAWLMHERTSGYSSLVFYRDLKEKVESDWSSVSSRLFSIMRRLLRRSNLVVNITGDEASLLSARKGPAREALLQLIQSLPEEEEQTTIPSVGPDMFDREPLWAAEARDKQMLTSGKGTAYILPTEMSDTCLSTPLLPPGSPIVGSDSVGASYLESGFLFRHVRELMGAYGAWSRITSDNVISFSSFRDPKAPNTYRTFRSTPSVVETWVETAEDEEVLEAVLPTIGSIDMPMSNQSKGTESFWQWIMKETEDHRNNFRRQIIDTDREQLRMFARKLKDALNARTEAVVFVGSEATAKKVIDSGEAMELIHLKVI